jgi:exopolysaccharide biosynthesis polyprenyl glycosylphosphotransferase
MSLPALEAPSLSPSLPTPAPARTKTAPSSYPRSWVAVLLTADLTMFVLSAYLAALIGFRHWDLARAADRLWMADGLFVLLWVVIFQLLGLYRRTCALSVKDELYYTVAALSLGVAPQLLLFTVLPGISTSRVVLLLSLGISILTVGSTRAVLHGIRKKVMRRHRRIAVVGDPERCARTLEALDLNEESSTLVIPISESELIGQNGNPGPLSGLEEISWFQQARDWHCDTLLLTEIVPPRLMPQLLQETARNQIRFAFAPPRIRCHSYGLSLQTDGQQALIVPSQLQACTPRARLIKGIFDVTLGLVALLIFSPIMLVAAAAIFLESGRPIFFRQKRVGLDGVQFDMLKFRSMHKDAEHGTGPVWAVPGDGRKTRVGSILRRLSFDELPQLINVLRGEMSLVGPRPERLMFVEMFRGVYPRYDERHLVRPGITGWSQIHMKRLLQTSDAGEKLSYDLHYVEQWSPFLDLSVLIQTTAEFLFHRAG